MPIEAYIVAGVACSLLMIWLAHRRLSGSQELILTNRLSTAVERLEKAVNDATQYKPEINEISEKLRNAEAVVGSLCGKMDDFKERMTEWHEWKKKVNMLAEPILKGVFKNSKITLSVELIEDSEIRVTVI